MRDAVELALGEFTEADFVSGMVLDPSGNPMADCNVHIDVDDMQVAHTLRLCQKPVESLGPDQVLELFERISILNRHFSIISK